MIFKRGISQLTLGLTSAVAFVCCLQAQERSWVDLAVHNFGAPIITMWAEGELSFAADGTMVYCSARQDMGDLPGPPRTARGRSGTVVAKGTGHLPGVPSKEG